jgi:hypothetical protein
MPRPHRIDPSSRRSAAMPIFTYLAVAGSMLIALLFVADATREKGTPAVVTNDQPIQSLAAAPAPAPEAQSTPEALAKVEPTAHAEQAEESPKKKRVTGRHRRQNHAWSRGRNFGQR